MMAGAPVTYPDVPGDVPCAGPGPTASVARPGGRHHRAMDQHQGRGGDDDLRGGRNQADHRPEVEVMMIEAPDDRPRQGQRDPAGDQRIDRRRRPAVLAHPEQRRRGENL